MDIQLTEEQELLRSTIQRFLREQYDFDERRKIVCDETAVLGKQLRRIGDHGNKLVRGERE